MLHDLGLTMFAKPRDGLTCCYQEAHVQRCKDTSLGLFGISGICWDGPHGPLSLSPAT
jgi:hypothetical protein